jgi:hypothetical protein
MAFAGREIASAISQGVAKLRDARSSNRELYLQQHPPVWTRRRSAIIMFAEFVPQPPSTIS